MDSASTALSSGELEAVTSSHDGGSNAGVSLVDDILSFDKAVVVCARNERGSATAWKLNRSSLL